MMRVVVLRSMLRSLVITLVIVTTLHHLAPSSAFLFPDLKFRTGGQLPVIVVIVIIAKLSRSYLSLSLSLQV